MTQMQKIGIYTVILLPLLGTLVLALRPHASGVASVSKEAVSVPAGYDPAGQDVLRAQVASLRRELVSLGNQVRGTGAESEPTPSSSDPPTEEVETPLSEEEQRTRDRERGKERQRKAIQKLENEAPDSSWGDQVREEARAVFGTLSAAEFPTTRLVASRCGGTLCEFEIEHGSRAEVAEFPEQFSLPSAPSGFGRSEPGREPGTYVTYVYTARAGHRVPQ